MTENNNFLISNKWHCENFREREKKKKKEKNPRISSWEITFVVFEKTVVKLSHAIFHNSQVSWIPRFVGYTFQKDRKLRLPSFQRLTSLIPERIRKEPILKSIYKMNHRWDLRISRRIPRALSILSSTCTRRRVRVAQFSREDCSYHPFETTTTTTRLRPLD